MLSFVLSKSSLAVTSLSNRFFSQRSKSIAELGLMDILRTKLSATNVDVIDISGGCGSMYEVSVESPQFAGKSMVAQHRMVNESLKAEIKQMHGLRISTYVPKSTK